MIGERREPASDFFWPTRIYVYNLRIGVLVACSDTMYSCKRTESVWRDAKPPVLVGQSGQTLVGLTLLEAAL